MRGLDAKTARTFYNDLRSDLWKARSAWLHDLVAAGATGLTGATAGLLIGAMAGGPHGAFTGTVVGGIGSYFGAVFKANYDYSKATVFAINDYWRKVSNETGYSAPYDFIQEQCKNTCWGGWVR